MINMKERLLLRWLIAVTSAVVLLNIINELGGIPFWQISRFIKLGEESNFPTWLSSLILAIAAVYSYRCSQVATLERAARLMWQLTSLGLWGMSCEEVATVHENMELALNVHFAIKENWTATFGIFIILFMFLFILRMSKYLKGSAKATRLLITGIIIYVGGAYFLESTYNFINHKTFKSFFIIENIMEESFEMYGAIIIIKGLMEHYKYMLNKYVYIDVLSKNPMLPLNS